MPLRSPIGFFQVKDRSQLRFQDPFPGLQHETAEVNGIKCVAAYTLSATCGFAMAMTSLAWRSALPYHVVCGVTESLLQAMCNMAALRHCKPQY